MDAHDSTAEELFAEFLETPGADFVDWVKAHPRQEDELRELHAAWGRLDALMMTRGVGASLADRLDRRFGPRVDPRINLSGDPVPAGPSQEIVSRLADRGMVSTRYRVEWKVDNPDGDALRYRLSVRREGARAWLPIHKPHEILTKPSHLWDTERMPDGWYRLRVEASDELASPPGDVLRSTHESEPFLLDNHPPDVEGLK